jgi:hypothetical protein
MPASAQYFPNLPPLRWRLCYSRSAQHALPVRRFQNDYAWIKVARVLEFSQDAFRPVQLFVRTGGMRILQEDASRGMQRCKVRHASNLCARATMRRRTVPISDGEIRATIVRLQRLYPFLALFC